jgi:hypothetical protein
MTQPISAAIAVIMLVMQAVSIGQAQNPPREAFDAYRSKVAVKGSGEPLHSKIVEVFALDPPPRVFAGQILLTLEDGRARRIWLGFSKTTTDIFFVDGNPKDNTFLTVFHADESLQLRAAAAGNGYNELAPVSTERVAAQFRAVLQISERFLAATVKKLK